MPKVLRAKDRLNPTTNINGLRDALLNLIVPETDGLVVELQLHFKKLHALKPMAHRVGAVHLAPDTLCQLSAAMIRVMAPTPAATSLSPSGLRIVSKSRLGEGGGSGEAAGGE